MTFLRFRPSALVVVGWMMTIFGGAALAAPSPVKNVGPSASGQLKKALKTLGKSSNYKLQATVMGGLADNPEHRVTNVTVRENYGGNVFRYGRSRMMEVPSIKAYKTPKAGKGVIYYQGNWVRLLAIQSGVKMDRLLYFPERILADAAKYSRSARWLDKKELAEGFNYGDDGKESEEEDEDSDASSDESDKDGPKGKTVVKSEEKEKVFQPRVLRVTAPAKAALKHWTLQVENSGCMKEG